MTLPQFLAALNAVLNATAGAFLLGAFIAIKQKRPDVHQRRIWIAFAASCLFLVSYLTRISIAGDTPFHGQGAIRYVYFTILISHVVLALVVVPLVLRSLYLGWKKRFVDHRRIARVTFPIWMYVSVTGVIVYLMLYQLPV